MNVPLVTPSWRYARLRAFGGITNWRLHERVSISHISMNFYGFYPEISVAMGGRIVTDLPTSANNLASEESPSLLYQTAVQPVAFDLFGSWVKRPNASVLTLTGGLVDRSMAWNNPFGARWIESVKQMAVELVVDKDVNGSSIRRFQILGECDFRCVLQKEDHKLNLEEERKPKTMNVPTPI